MDEKTDGQLRVIRRVVAVTRAAGVPVWLFGGWGLDARIGRITREHGDVEFWVERIHAGLSKAALVEAGAVALATQPPEEACEFTWDGVPFSTAYFDRRPDGSFSQPEGRWSDWLFPPGSFGDAPGMLDGMPVPAMSASGMLAMKEQYPNLRNGGPWRQKDIRDIAILRKLALDEEPAAGRLELRQTFNGTAELYDAARPRYPEQLFDDLAALAGLERGSRVLEIAPGTGQASVSLASRGYDLTAVELGEDLAQVARRNLDRFPGARVEVAPFEQWPLPRRPFDLVASFTAWHWLDPGVRFAKAADALREGGTLAIVSTHHVDGGTREFFAAAQRCYEKWDPATEPGQRLRPASDITVDDTELLASGRFEHVEHRRYELEISYTAQQYLNVLSTYSGHIALSETRRAGLYGCISNLIHEAHGGMIAKRYMFEMTTAGKSQPR